MGSFGIVNIKANFCEMRRSHDFVSNLVGEAGWQTSHETALWRIEFLDTCLIAKFYVYPDFVEIGVYAPWVGVAAGAKSKRYLDF